MEILRLFIGNIFNFQLICFLIGFATALSLKRPTKLPGVFKEYLAFYILFAVGLKGGGPLSQTPNRVFFL